MPAEHRLKCVLHPGELPLHLLIDVEYCIFLKEFGFERTLDILQKIAKQIGDSLGPDIFVLTVGSLPNDQNNQLRQPGVYLLWFESLEEYECCKTDTERQKVLNKLIPPRRLVPRAPSSSSNLSLPETYIKPPYAESKEEFMHRWRCSVAPPEDGKDIDC